jgi:hypothetical protein
VLTTVCFFSSFSRPDLAEQVRLTRSVDEVYTISAGFQVYERSDWGEVFLRMVSFLVPLFRSFTFFFAHYFYPFFVLNADGRSPILKVQTTPFPTAAAPLHWRRAAGLCGYRRRLLGRWAEG